MGFKESRRRLLGVAVLCLAVLWAGAAAARTVLELDAAHQPVPLGDWGDTWMETGDSASPKAVAADKAIAWEPTREQAVYPLTPTPPSTA